MNITYREATTGDIKQLFEVRMSVMENVLVNTSLVTDELCAEYLTNRGKGWMCEADGIVAGFAIADLADDSIWALFVRPEYEKRGIGKRLRQIMLEWYFGQGKERVWLSTVPGTRAEQFYRMTGWRETGRTGSGEIRFEMTGSEYNGF